MPLSTDSATSAFSRYQSPFPVVKPRIQVGTWVWGKKSFHWGMMENGPATAGRTPAHHGMWGATINRVKDERLRWSPFSGSHNPKQTRFGRMAY